MKLRRILATAVAAAVTTPVVFLSATPAFADTKPSPSPTQKSTSEEPDEDMPSLEELKEAVALAQKAYDEAVVELDKAMADFKILDKDDHPLQVAVADAKKAADAAATAKTTADDALAAAEKALAELPTDATEEQKATATAAVAAAKRTADEAATAKTAADEKLVTADTARDDAMVAASRVIGLAQKVKKAAAEDLDEARDELKFFEEIGGECEEENTSLTVALSGPKTVTAGEPTVFSLRVTNTSDAPLDDVNAFAGALRIPEGDDVIDEETDFADRMIPVEWSSADNLEWTSFTEEFDSIEIGRLAKGAHYDVKLRLTVAADAPAGKGAAFSQAEYEANDGDCGMGDFADVTFDILAAKGDKPKPEPTPTPSATTTTPTPAPSTAGNTNTTPQGGSSTTRVNGSLAATGADDTLPLGLAAGAAVALGAGAVFFARRRKADANA
ncbi:LPXTG cell wall anchor domain-containing protein [Streptomyces sp. NPDC051742]|uniref:LPXTG cell wall anchor domain-containing protein n=1 Tax=unclassified Streptomyces TaxID=2593676 RepID=UPI00343E965A